jgi:hypothetical protein
MVEEKESEFSLSVVIDGASFSAKGPRGEVMRLYTEWKELAGLRFEPAPKRPTFNPPRIGSAPRIPTVSAW